MYKKLIYIILILSAAYLIIHKIVRRKIETTLQDTITYKTLDFSLLTGSISVDSINLINDPDKLHIDHLAITNIGLIQFLRSKELHIKKILIRGCTATLNAKPPANKPKLPFNDAAIGQIEIQDLHITKEQTTFDGNLTLDTIHLKGNLTIQHIHLIATSIRHTIPNQHIYITGLSLDSRKDLANVHIDTLHVTPVNAETKKQTDRINAKSENINIEALDLKSLYEQNELEAKTITIAHNHIHVYRDRGLPRDTTRKPMPVEALKALPIAIRIDKLKLGPSTFIYEEQPAKGALTGALRIENLHGTIHPLINHPTKGDPRYITMEMQGSLMGSGSVTAITKLPLDKQDPYLVEGAFHNLDVTSLNPSAENLGLIHLESGMLNQLEFKFSMTEQAATGSIIGEYHNLVVQKLKGSNENKKVDKIKSFFLRHLIIPKDKDKSLPVAKRTGKVDYKHDPTRNFSYYMLHALLVGVKSSFKLGFLLPG